MVRARTTQELIRELDEEARYASAAALVVALPATSLLIWANDMRRTDKLTDALAGGGEPVGLIRRTADGARTRSFCEYSDSDTARTILDRLEAAPPIPPADPPATKR